MKNRSILTLFVIVLSACAVNTIPQAAPTATPAEITVTSQPTRNATATLPSPVEATPTPSDTPEPAPAQSKTQAALDTCDIEPVIAPTTPALIPGYTELDETTGLHMTGEVQVIDLADYRLKVSGMVDRPLSLRYDDLRCLPKVTTSSPLICPGFFTDRATWSGAPIKAVLDQAGVQPEAKTVVLISADGYEAPVSVDAALNPHNFLAYEWEGQPLPILHGFPVRAVFPSEAGGKWVKWLVEIIVE